MAVTCALSRFTAALSDSYSPDGSTDTVFFHIWIRPTTADDNSRAMSWGQADSNDEYASIGQSTSGAGRYFGMVRVGGANDNLIGGLGAVPTDGNWGSVGMAVLSDTERELFGDGVSVQTDTTSRNLDSIDTAIIGANPGSTANDFAGDLAEAAMWGGAGLTSAICLQMSAALAAGASPLTVKPDLLVHYWPMYNTSYLVDLVGGNALSEVTATATNAATHPPVFGRAMPYIITAPAAAAGGYNMIPNVHRHMQQMGAG